MSAKNLVLIARIKKHTVRGKPLIQLSFEFPTMTKSIRLDFLTVDL